MKRNEITTKDEEYESKPMPKKPTLHIPTIDEVSEYLQTPIPLISTTTTTTTNSNAKSSSITIIPPIPTQPKRVMITPPRPPMTPSKPKSSHEEKTTKTTALTTTRFVIVNPLQTGNPVLQYLRNIPWKFGESDEESIPDYSVNTTTGILFLSVRYHLLHSDYIHGRISSTKKKQPQLIHNIILVLIDVQEQEVALVSLRELSILAISVGFVLICVWSDFEAARYIESFKTFENKSADAIREQNSDESDLNARVSDCLTSIKSINKTDAVNLMRHFGSIRSIANASMEELALCPGIGPSKVRRLYSMFHNSFSKLKQISTPTSNI